ncbi:MAG: FG-GAP repeat protein, partial [Deltaproteobacteria bacterium]|nr:FG-GAP repeat protein [Deltaproteobacteria bacterium]
MGSGPADQSGRHRFRSDEFHRASDAADRDSFGASVAVSGDAIVVGAERNDDAGESSG